MYYRDCVLQRLCFNLFPQAETEISQFTDVFGSAFDFNILIVVQWERGKSTASWDHLPHKTEETGGSISQISEILSGNCENSGHTVGTAHINRHFTIDRRWISRWMKRYWTVNIWAIWLLYLCRLIHYGFRVKDNPYPAKFALIFAVVEHST